MNNQVMITDYTEHGNSLYVNVEVFDAAQNKLHKAEVRFLDGMLYGDFIHGRRSPLSDECREETIEYLKSFFRR